MACYADEWGGRCGCDTSKKVGTARENPLVSKGKNERKDTGETHEMVWITRSINVGLSRPHH